MASPDFLPARRVWERYGVTQMTLWRWLRDKEMHFPKPIYLGRFRYWRIAELEAWEAEQAQKAKRGARGGGRMSHEEARARGRAKAEAVLAALEPLDDHELLIVADEIGDRLIRAGTPVPPFTTAAAEAQDWAAWASLPELRAYAAATFLRLPSGDQRDFLDWARRKVRAAA